MRYGECDKALYCIRYLNVNRTVNRLKRDTDIEKNTVTGWDIDERVSYTSYVKEDKHETKQQMSILYQYKVHPSDFLHYFSTSLMDYIYHIAKLRRQKHAHRDQDQNFLPSMLLLDIDFSQNFVYTDRITSIQSDHWSSSSVTLFVAVLRYLSILIWNKPPIGLKKGQPVSVVCETKDGGGNVYAYGEVAVDHDNQSLTICVRILKDNMEYHIPCEHIRVREVISVPLIVVSDSKLHDTFFVRHFISDTLLGRDGWLLNQTREPGLSSRIKAIDICSDGAAAHFKQKGSVHFLSSLQTFSYAWVFGCPGHGKGTWDGLGGIVKNKTGKLIKADGLFLSSPHEVYTVIFELFASEKAQARFDANPKTVIKEWKILWLPDKDIDRPKVDGISENKISDLKAFHGVGTRSLFSFRILHRDGFAVRLSGCHCCYCIRGYCPEGFGTTPMGCLSMEPTQYLICCGDIPLYTLVCDMYLPVYPPQPAYFTVLHLVVTRLLY
jgi:hypothetical protein